PLEPPRDLGVGPVTVAPLSLGALRHGEGIVAALVPCLGPLRLPVVALLHETLELVDGYPIDGAAVEGLGQRDRQLHILDVEVRRLQAAGVSVLLDRRDRSGALAA